MTFKSSSGIVEFITDRLSDAPQVGAPQTVTTSESDTMTMNTCGTNRTINTIIRTKIDYKAYNTGRFQNKDNIWNS